MVENMSSVKLPLAIDLFCGLGGWTEGLVAERYEVIGFDIERHRYGDAKYPAQLVLQDVLTLHGRQFKDAALIVASPPCQEYSYMAMPWSRAKAIAVEYREGKRDMKKLTALFDACFRLQREAIEAAGHFIPLVVENVRGAIPWVGRSRWNYGSFHLWGDIPALMPTTKGMKNNGGSWFNIGSPGQKVIAQNPDGRLLNKRNGHRSTAHLTNPDEHGVKGVGCGSASWQKADERHPNDPRNFYSRSSARKAASAQIAKIPLPLARHIARTWRPHE